MNFIRTFSVLLTLSSLGLTQTVTLTGRVIERAAMAPVPGAVVRLKNTNLSTTTDAAGRFTLSGIPTSLQPRTVEWKGPIMDREGLRFQSLISNVLVETDLYDTQGKSIASATFTLDSPGLHVLPVFKNAPSDFVGFLRVKAGNETYDMKVLRHGGPSSYAEAKFVPNNGSPLAKTSAVGDSVQASMAGLLTKTVSAPTNADLGDIIMDYPPRATIGVGAARPFGTVVLFDGTQGPAAAAAELSAKWLKWRDWTPTCQAGASSTKNTSPANFKVAKDPEFPNDTNRVTLRSDFVTGSIGRWGCDDIEARPNLYAHGDVQIHAEWTSMGVYDTLNRENPDSSATHGTTATAAYYVNSGVYVQNRYEIQIQSAPYTAAITDCHYMGSVVNEFAPSSTTGGGTGGTCATGGFASPCTGCGASNQIKQNGKWQSYDITFRTSRWNGTTKTADGYLSMWWNGVLVHYNRRVTGLATGLANTSGEAMDANLYGLKLQRERGDVRFRNVWMKHLKIDSTNTTFGY